MKTIEETSKDYALRCGMEIETEIEDNGEFDYEAFIEEAFKAGVKFAQRWIPVTEELPFAYETGNWDGKRSDFVLAKNIHGKVFIARTYQGFIDGFNFCDFVDYNDTVMSHIIEWRPVELS